MFVLHENLAELGPHAETSHTDHGLTYLADGWIRMEYGEELEIAPGSVIVTPAGVPHRPIAGRDIEYWLVGFCPACIDLDESQLLMSPFRAVRHGALPVVDIPADRRPRVVQLLGDLRDESQRGAPESLVLSRSLLLLILGELRRCMPAARAPSPEGSLVSGALEYIQQHCLGPLSLAEVAAAVHRSPAHVTTTVKASTGYSVGEWINAGRVSEAANRLAHTDDSLDDIAARIGWKDKTHFIRQFRKAHGLTPAAWRKQHRASHDHPA